MEGEGGRGREGEREGEERGREGREGGWEGEREGERGRERENGIAEAVFHFVSLNVIFEKYTRLTKNNSS